MQLGKPYYLQRYRGRVGGASGGGGGGGATFVNVAAFNLVGASDSNIPIPASAAANDILVVEVLEGGANTTTTLTANGSSGAFTKASGPDLVASASSYAYLFWKVLTSGDISNGFLTVANGFAQDPLIMSLYRGATTVTVQGFQQPGSTTTTFAGFAPSGSSKGVGVSFVQTATPGTLTVTASGWTQRYGGPTSIAGYGGATLDELSGYTNASVGFAGFAAGGSIAGYMFEFT